MRKNGFHLAGLAVLLIALVASACTATPTTAPVENIQPQATADSAAPVPEGTAYPEPALPAGGETSAYPVPAAPVAGETSAYPEPITGGGEAVGVSGVVVYKIVQSESLAGFAVSEVLRGSPFTAQGVTDQITGEITIDFTAATVQMSPIVINATTLKTDSGMRDRAIGQFILESGKYPTITFTPKQINGLPPAAAIGDEVTLQITGDLTIREITKEVTFEAKVKLVSAERLEGEAIASVLRSDYELQIPNVPSVASVEDTVHLKIEFVATR